MGKILIGAVIVALAAGSWFGFGKKETPKPKGPGVVPVVSAMVAQQDMPVLLNSHGTVTALQSVEVRAQISATIRAVHVREGQDVRQGERLFSLDVRSEEANLGKAEAQLTKSRTDHANAERQLRRQRELFTQKFISQTALDAAQNQVDSLAAQVAADQAAVRALQVNRGFGDITAPIAGRLGTIAVYPGSLVQPAGPALVTITTLVPIDIAFTLPERELPALRAAMTTGAVPVTARLEDGSEIAGSLGFVDNSVDTASGTIRLKARFANADSRLWPGMFAIVRLAPRTLKDALTVPAQAVQTGPERSFVYVIGADDKVSPVTVTVPLIQDGTAVIAAAEGIAVGTPVVVEGAQNLRPGSQVIRSPSGQPQRPAK